MDYFNRKWLSDPKRLCSIMKGIGNKPTENDIIIFYKKAYGCTPSILSYIDFVKKWDFVEKRLLVSHFFLHRFEFEQHSRYVQNIKYMLSSNSPKEEKILLEIFLKRLVKDDNNEYNDSQQRFFLDNFNFEPFQNNSEMCLFLCANYSKYTLNLLKMFSPNVQQMCFDKITNDWINASNVNFYSLIFGVVQYISKHKCELLPFVKITNANQNDWEKHLRKNLKKCPSIYLKSMIIKLQECLNFDIEDAFDDYFAIEGKKINDVADVFEIIKSTIRSDLFRRIIEEYIKTPNDLQHFLTQPNYQALIDNENIILQKFPEIVTNESWILMKSL